MKRAPLLLVAALVVAGSAWFVLREQDGPARDARGPAATQGAPDTPARRLAAEAARLDERGEHAVSAQKFAAAAKLAEQEGDAALARAYRAQSGVCLKMSGQPGPARELLLPVLAEARAQGDRRTEGLALGNLARVESMLGNDARGLAYLDELAAFAAAEGDAWLQVKTLEQVASGALALGDPQTVLERVDAALVVDETLAAEQRRRDGLLSLRASALVLLGDDAGADNLWASLPQTSAVLGNRARHAATLELHPRAAELAFAAAQGFESDGEGRRAERDRALLLSISELLAAGELDLVQARLDKLMAGTDDELALAPFLVLRGRLALRRGAPRESIGDLRRAQAACAGTAGAQDAGLLLAFALLQAEQFDEALAELSKLPETLAQQFLLARVFTLQPPETALIREELPGLRPEAWNGADDSLLRLRELTGGALPSLAFTALEAGLADSQRLRDQGGEVMADVLLATAARDALRWQALEAVAARPGPPPDAVALTVLGAWADRWVERRQPAGHALAAVLPGDTVSYLLLCTPELGATTLPLPGRRVLHERALAVAEALRGGDVHAVAVAANALYTTVFLRRAQEDLRNAEHWTLVLPPELACVPPAMWVTEVPRDGADVAWLVEERQVTLLPHGPVPGPRPGADAPGGDPLQAEPLSVEPLKPEPVGWLSMGTPAVDRTRLPLVAEQWFVRFGESVFNAAPAKPVEAGVTLAGPNATVAALRLALDQAEGLQLSLPGVGAGRLGGLLFAPSEGPPFADEAAGFLPWHRCATLPLPPQLILDSTRFDPGDAAHGPGWAASALLAQSRQVLFTRWPMPAPVRDAMVGHLQQEREAGGSLAAALTAVQRSWLAAARAAGDATAQHPRLWAAWLPWGED